MMFTLDLIEHLRAISFEEHLYKDEYPKRVQDLDKTSPAGGKVYSDKKNESFHFIPFWKK
jgi:hypothetical protein